MKLRKMSVEEKIARLSEMDKAYILGYIDRALLGIEDWDKLPKQDGKKRPTIKKKPILENKDNKL